MRRVMVRYRVKPDRAAENERYIRDVFAELDRKKPDQLRYASFKLDDGLSFVHLASIETADGKNPLNALSTFQEFGERIKERCDEPPVVAELNEVGVYRMFG